MAVNTIVISREEENKDFNDYEFTWYGDKNVYVEAEEIAQKLYSSR